VDEVVNALIDGERWVEVRLRCLSEQVGAEYEAESASIEKRV
jgi:hypothetical protein